MCVRQDMGSFSNSHRRYIRTDNCKGIVRVSNREGIIGATEEIRTFQSRTGEESQNVQTVAGYADCERLKDDRGEPVSIRTLARRVGLAS